MADPEQGGGGSSCAAADVMLGGLVWFPTSLDECDSLDDDLTLKKGCGDHNTSFTLLYPIGGLWDGRVQQVLQNCQ
jgi:hypothetical protein